MRIGYVAVQALGRDGWGRYAAEVVRAVRGRGLDPLLVVAQPEVEARLASVEVHPILPQPFAGRLGALRSLAHSPRLRRILSGCDVVHCLVEPYLPLVVSSMPPGIPLVLTAHGSWAVQPLRSAPRRWFYARALRRVDLLVCQSDYTRAQIAFRTELPPHIVQPAGVDPDAFQSGAAFDLPAWARAGPIVLSVGALKPRKGYDIALQAVSLATRAFPQLHYVIIGEGESGDYADRLRRQAQELGLSERVHLLGSVAADELAAWYRRAEVFLLLPIEVAGSFEGLGLAYLEAAAAGLPCIGTRDCGAQEAVADGETGLLVPPGDAGAAAEALLRLLGSQDLRSRMGQAGRRRAEQFTWARLAERLQTEYERLASGTQ